MPIVYVHGVSVRDDREWNDLELLLRRYVAPVIASDSENVHIARCYWGDFGAKFRWNGACAPDSPLRHALQKLTDASALPKLETISTTKERLRTSSQKLADKTRGAIETLKAGRLGTLNKDTLSDLLASSFSRDAEQIGDAADAVAMIAADEVASDSTTFERLANCNSVQEEITVLNELVSTKYRSLKKRIDNSKVPRITQQAGVEGCFC